jgi:hypothetical protein
MGPVCVLIDRRTPPSAIRVLHLPSGPRASPPGCCGLQHACFMFLHDARICALSRACTCGQRYSGIPPRGRSTCPSLNGSREKLERGHIDASSPTYFCTGSRPTSLHLYMCAGGLLLVSIKIYRCPDQTVDVARFTRKVEIMSCHDQPMQGSRMRQRKRDHSGVSCFQRSE